MLGETQLCAFATHLLDLSLVRVLKVICELLLLWGKLPCYENAFRLHPQLELLGPLLIVFPCPSEIRRPAAR